MVNRYPLWKNLLLALVAVLGFLYAAPNIFGENPAVQISGKQDTQVNSSVLMQVKQVLTEQRLSYQSIHLSPRSLLIRFTNTDAQLKASDVLKAVLGPNYTVALNLAPATPSWLKAIGAAPMKLGLDLRGGVHFLLSVDVSSVITQRLQGRVDTIRRDLREQQIRYANIQLQNNNTIVLQFRDVNQAKAALVILRNNFPDMEFTDQSNGVRYQFIAALNPSALQHIQQYTLDQTMTTLRNRVNELGVSEAIVQQQGANRVSVDLPGIQDTAHAKEILGGTATVEFRLVNHTYDPRNAAAMGVPLGTRLYQWEGQPLLLSDQVILTGNSIVDASSSFDDAGRPSVNIRLGGGGESLFHQVTAENVGNPLATVYVETQFVNQMVNGKVIKVAKKIERVINVAKIQSALGNSFQITGLTSSQEAQNLSLLLRAGALPAAINYEAERTVGPTLGQENIQKGMLSLEIALAIVIIFMAIYYRIFGLVADVALILNLVLLVAVLSLLGATLTLPGIAGIVLNVGMAVDANVLIYERIREELRNGNTPQASIYAGYERAFVTILDANITTLIVAMVLFGIGTDAIKGFAVTLTVGLLTSMLTGVIMTRAMINKIYGTRQVKQLSIGI